MANQDQVVPGMRKSFLAILLLLPGLLQAQTISFSFDDGLDPRVQPEAAAWKTQLLAALDRGAVKSMLFPAGKIVDSPEGLALVRNWSEHGHAIGNHTYSHRNLGSAKTSLDFFTADILKDEQLVKELPGWTPRLRFPFLKEGDTAEKRDGLRAWMTQHGYRSAPVSIDTSDWYYSQRFLKWRRDHPRADLAAFRDLYLAHLLDRAQYYDRLARQVLGRSPAHVMLLHTNAVNATFLPEVIAMFRAQGWKIVSPVEAFSDPLYAQAPTALPAGESIVWALAKQAGVPGLRYPAEDGEYEAKRVDALP